MFSIKGEPGLLVTKPDIRPADSGVASHARRYPAVKAALVRILVTIHTLRGSCPCELLDLFSIYSVARMALVTWYGLVPSVERHSGRVVHYSGIRRGDKPGLQVASSTIARVGPACELPRMGIRMATRASFVAGEIHRHCWCATSFPVTLHTFQRKVLSPQRKVRRPMVVILHWSFAPACLNVTSFAPCLRLACSELAIVRVSVAVCALLEFLKSERVATGLCAAA